MLDYKQVLSVIIQYPITICIKKVNKYRGFHITIQFIPYSNAGYVKNNICVKFTIKCVNMLASILLVL